MKRRRKKRKKGQKKIRKKGENGVDKGEKKRKPGFGTLVPYSQKIGQNKNLQFRIKIAQNII